MANPIVLPTHPRFKNLAGKKFGRWSVVAYAGRSKGKHSLWDCICECGTEKTVLGLHVVRGASKSCGCLSSETTAKRNISHGMTGTPEHQTWQRMKQRCLYKKISNYHDYGGRGIKICDRWKDSFENFLADMGNKPSQKHSIDRIDNNGNYEPGNCRWATRTEQNRNTRQNRLLTFQGKTQCVSEWADELKIPAMAIRRRLHCEWSTKDALRPLRPKFHLLTLNGITRTIPEWANVLGMMDSTLYARLRRGWSIKKSLTFPVGPSNRKAKTRSYHEKTKKPDS